MFFAFRHATVALFVVASLLSGCAPGPQELLIILAIVILLFGATRLPKLGKALGETIHNFRNSTDEAKLVESEEDESKRDA